jgi:hypothetical protein
MTGNGLLFPALMAQALENIYAFDSFFSFHRGQLIELVARHRLPAAYGGRFFVQHRQRGRRQSAHRQ